MKTTDEIQRLLNKYKHLRDSDNKLIATYWFNEIKEKGQNIYEMSAFDFLKLYSDSKLTNAETIRRMRAKLQEEKPELRGDVYNLRMDKKQKQWRTDLGYEVNKQT
jgi:hypothetical protein